MREIKFRAFNTKLNRMIYPDDYGWFNDAYVWIGNGHIQTTRLSTIVSGEVKELVPMQYVGLKDHNDTDIYEGDIVQFTYGERPEVSSFDGGHDVVDGWTEDEFLEVKFVHGSFMIGKHLLWALKEWPFDYSLKVVGNVYQNRELLDQNKRS